MSRANRLLTVVIASVCDEARGELLKRACESVRTMAGVHAYSILVVANGPNVSAGVLAWLRTRSDVRLVQLRTGSHPLARRLGAELADSEFLAFLDDDDELLPDTFQLKLNYFREHPEVDVLVTDGWRVNGPTVTRIFPALAARAPDLVETMLHAAWGACALTLRTPEVELRAFDAEFRHLEWTLTALELARRYKVGYLDVATYRYYDDTPSSLSKAAEHSLAAPEVWRRLSVCYAGTPYETAVRRRRGIECHNVCWEFARRGQVGDAWRYHLASLRAPGGLSFLMFTRKLLAIAMWRPASWKAVSEGVNLERERL